MNFSLLMVTVTMEMVDDAVTIVSEMMEMMNNVVALLHSILLDFLMMENAVALVASQWNFVQFDYICPLAQDQGKKQEVSEEQRPW